MVPGLECMTANRARAILRSSAFEHVFIGEVKYGWLVGSTIGSIGTCWRRLENLTMLGIGRPMGQCSWPPP